MDTFEESFERTICDTLSFFRWCQYRLFRRSDAGNTTYDFAFGSRLMPCDDAILIEYRFVGRCLAKMFFDGLTCLEASLNIKILKYIVGEPIVFDDLQLARRHLGVHKERKFVQD